MIVVIGNIRQKRVLHQLHNKRPMLRVLHQTPRKNKECKLQNPDARNVQNSLINEVVDGLGPVCRPVERWRRVPDDLKHGSRGMHILKRSFSVAQLDGGDAQRPDIGPVSVTIVVLVASRTGHHFRRHPARATHASAALTQSAA